MPPFLQIVTLLLVTAVIVVNGWTDAPNAIVSVVATKTMSYGAAVRMAAACNLLGILLMSALTASVADTISAMVNFGGEAEKSLAALCAAMLSIVCFAVFAWWFGIPTSESHALIAGLTGAALALNRQAGVYAPAWGRVLLGLLLSVVLGFAGGFAATRLLGMRLKRVRETHLRRLQVWAAGGMAFMHGAQDGQKFLAVLVIADSLALGQYRSGNIHIADHRLALLFCAAAMALGTGMGGKRIIDTVGSRMVTLQKHQAVCADLSSSLCLLAASLLGIPTSTTHTRTTAVMGVGAADQSARPNLAIMRTMLTAWAVTFPVCGALGFCITKLFLLFF